MFKKWKGRRQPFLAIDILLSLTIFSMAAVIFIYPEAVISKMMVILMFLLGLSFLNQSIEMFVTEQRKYFVLTLLTSIVLISTSLWNYF